VNREDIELYMMGQYDGDVAALERAMAEDPALAQIAAEEARLEELLRDAAAAATFCPACDDLVRETRCDSCGAAVKPGGYTVERVLVSNAHGRMYVARDADGRRVALKELAFVQAPSPAALAAFEREARFLRALEHPAIPRFLASFEEGSGVHTRYYLAQELVEGTSLDRLDDHWYTEAEITALARQVLEVLVYLQSLSPMVIHRDIKPANLIRRADGSIALVDFGAAHVHGTTAGVTTIGTFGYMPIEQLAGLVDATTDGFALGMTLLNLMSRQEPWKLAQQRATVNASAPVRAFLDKLTAVEPKDRFASAKDALAALNNPAAIAAPKKRRPALIAAVAGVAFAAAGGGVFALAHRTHHHAPPPTLSSISTVHVKLTPNTPAPLEVDNRFVATVQDGQDVPVTAGAHHFTIGGSTGKCVIDDVTEPGKTTTLECNLPHPTPAPPKLLSDKKVTWSLEHVKLHDFVLLAANTCGFSAVIADNIDAATTVQVKDAPCDQAFEVVLQSLGLAYAYDPVANLVRVAPLHELEDDLARDAAGVVVASSLPDGNKVDIDLKNADIRDTLKMLIAGSGGSYNLVVPDDIQAKVTIRLEKVPWNHAFEAVLASQGLWYRYRENGKLILIAPRHQIEDENARERAR
jgi:serine/threonine protein kinase